MSDKVICHSKFTEETILHAGISKEKNVTIKKYQNKIKEIKNDKIKKSLIELSKVFRQK